jgi:hypothetical protein
MGSFWDPEKLIHNYINCDPIKLRDRFFYDLPNQSGPFTLGNNAQYSVGRFMGSLLDLENRSIITLTVTPLSNQDWETDSSMIFPISLALLRKVIMSSSLLRVPLNGIILAPRITDP